MSERIIVKPLPLVANIWLRQAKYIIGVEFVPDTLRRTIIGECIKAMKESTAEDARDIVFHMVLRWWKSSDYARERNKRNWKNRVKPLAMENER